MKKQIIFILVLVALVMSACAQSLSTAPAATPTPILPINTLDVGATVQSQVDATMQAMATQTSTPTPTAIPATAETVATSTPTATVEVVTDPYQACPTGSLGKHPDSDEPLIFVKDPYPGVLCEYEVYFTDKDYLIDLPAVQGALMADWSHGKFWDAITGELMDACPTGFKCEGTWVLTGKVMVPAGTLVHVYVYPVQADAALRFVGTPNEMTEARKGSFACEYLAYGDKGHDNRNIRVPAWVPEGIGSIFNHSGCVGFAYLPGSTEETAIDTTVVNTEPLCPQPNGDPWKWSGAYWLFENNGETTFVVPETIDFVLYINAVTKQDYKVYAGDSVKNASYVEAYCK